MIYRFIVAVTLLSAMVAYFLFLQIPVVHYRLPQSFSGWVVVSYSKSNCANGDSEAGVIAIKISEDGIGCSKKEIDSEFIRSKWVLVDENNHFVEEISEVPWGSNRTGVWGHAILERDETGLKKEYFFIGNESQLEQSWEAMPTK